MIMFCWCRLYIDRVIKLFMVVGWYFMFVFYCELVIGLNVVCVKLFSGDLVEGWKDLV